MPRKKQNEIDIVDVVLKEVFAELARQNIAISIDGMMQMAAAVKKRVGDVSGSDKGEKS